MKSGAHAAALARKILRALPLAAEELQAQLRQAVDPEYWRELCPDLTVTTGETRRRRKRTAAPHEIRETVERLHRQGYLDAQPILVEPTLGRMRRAVESLRTAGWPPVFSFVYDEFWTVWSAAPLGTILETTLGADYQLIGHPWAWYVSGARDAGGWAPHVDGASRRDRLSIWIALTDATLDNGCMYVVPKDRVAHLPIRRMAAGRARYRWRDWAPLLHCCRALPTPAGSAIGWDFETLHWGSVCHRIGAPRISIAAYFMPRGSKPQRAEARRFAPSQMPSFVDRLQTVAFSIRYFKPNEVRNRRYLALADRLARWTPATGGT